MDATITNSGTIFVWDWNKVWNSQELQVKQLTI